MASYWCGQWTLGTFYQGDPSVSWIYGPTGYATNVYRVSLFGPGDHTSTVDDKPETGVNWSTYWTKISGTYRGAWTISTSYNYADFVINNGYLYQEKAYGHTSAAESEPGVGVNWTSYWTERAEPEVITTDPWYGFSLQGTFFLPTYYEFGLTGTMLVADAGNKFVLRVGAFTDAHVGYDDLEDILSDCGVTFV